MPRPNNQLTIEPSTWPMLATLMRIAGEKELPTRSPVSTASECIGSTVAAMKATVKSPK
jgi:hypothetical protein